MMDNKDREVCHDLKNYLLDGLFYINGIKEIGPWEVEGLFHTDPGFVIHLIKHKGTALQARATVVIEYEHQGRPSWPL